MGRHVSQSLSGSRLGTLIGSQVNAFTNKMANLTNFTFDSLQINEDSRSEWHTDEEVKGLALVWAWGVSPNSLGCFHFQDDDSNDTSEVHLEHNRRSSNQPNPTELQQPQGNDG